MTDVTYASVFLKDKQGNTATVHGVTATIINLIQGAVNDTKTNKDGLAELKSRVDKVVDAQGKPLEAAKATTTALGSVMLASDADVAAGTEGKVVDAKQLATVKTDLSKVYKYKGTVETYSALPKSDVNEGDVYNVKAKHGNVPAGANYAAHINDSGAIEWDDLGGSIDTSDFALKTQDNTFSGNNTFTGKVVVPAPTADTEAATKAYVDGAVAGKTVVSYSATKPADPSAIALDSVVFYPAEDLITAAV